ARLEVDTRTVRRYVMILRDHGVPVAMRRGRHGGYSLPPGYRQPLALTKQEALALTYGLLGSGQQALGLDERDATRALRKVTRVLPAATRDLIGALDGAVTFATARIPCEAISAPDCLDAIVHAIQANHQVRMRYQAQAGEVTERVVDPYQVVHRAGRWYLVGYCHLRADQRVFRLDHIQRTQELPEPFAPTVIDAVAAVERSIAMTPWQWEFEVLAEAPLAELRTRIPATVATLHPRADGVLLRGFANDLDWLAYTLAGLRCPLVIVRPDELRDHLRALAERIRDIAERECPQPS
ncbi:MAG TPA: WYL domain-containing protein, partial [Ktedonobacterales bacterium]|nr:WYL domain-containing protein [Ktedonobacterales bacterium]